MKNTIFFLFLATFIGLLLNSCKNDPKLQEKVILKERLGNWNMIEAKKDGEVTALLENGFISFEENKLTHNLSGDTLTVDYEISDNKITSIDPIFQNAELSRVYNDTTVIVTKYGNFLFEFILKKNDQ